MDGWNNTPFTEQVRSVSAGASTEELAFERVRPGHVRRYRRFGFRDATTAATRLRFVIRSGNTDVLVNEQSPIAADTFYWDPDGITLTEGQELVARVTGTTASDVLWLDAYGEQWETQRG